VVRRQSAALRQRHGLVLAALTVLAALLRFPTLDTQSFWFDEAVTVTLVRDSLSGMLGALPDLESTPPLYYVLAWLWARAFGTGEIGLRSLSALLGTATLDDGE
jgi:mannosyltransferase